MTNRLHDTTIGSKIPIIYLTSDKTSLKGMVGGLINKRILGIICRFNSQLQYSLKNVFFILPCFYFSHTLLLNILLTKLSTKMNINEQQPVIIKDKPSSHHDQTKQMPVSCHQSPAHVIPRPGHLTPQLVAVAFNAAHGTVKFAAFHARHVDKTVQRRVTSRRLHF